MTKPLVQSAVNISEGRRPDVIGRLLDVARQAPEARLVDWSADPDHNRMVATLLCSPAGVRAAVLAMARVAVETIDLREHSGAHPRIGAVDVIPLTPIRAVSMDDCVALGAEVASDLAALLGLPVYFYERSAEVGRARALPEIRKGGFEGLVAGPLEGLRRPDMGPSEVHPTAGAVVVGARTPLVAYNVNLVEPDVAVARRVAAAVRRARTELPALVGARALGLWLPSAHRAQVSLNLTQPALTPLPGVYDFVKQEAERLSANVHESELIGLVPQASLAGQCPERIQWRGWRPSQIIDWWLERL